MDLEKVKKLYTRFLKDRGIYARAKELLLNKWDGKRYTSIDALYKELDTDPRYWFENDYFFCLWKNTSEGDTFWWCHSLMWKVMCVENGIKLPRYTPTKETDILVEIDNILHRGAFRGDLTDEQKEELLSVREKYNEIINNKNNET